MKKMGVNEIRDKYLSFFESKGHLKIESASLVPKNDKSLLIINSGMAPLKPYFTGAEVPPSKRVTDAQKCIRTGDIENVGVTARHFTFFEMLGNFSFGDYFKNEAIAWAWEFVTEVLEMPKEKIYISVYEEDDETYQIWNKVIGIPETHLKHMGKEDNFWEVGVGPCGPCTELYYDRGEKYSCGSEDCGFGCECDRYIEFWNLVLTQFERTEDGSLVPLENPNIDTGMGLERIACIMQEAETVFDIDTLVAIRNKVCEVANYKYGTSDEKDTCVRIITDHIRSVIFMTSDGILPSNEGRGYVLRRLLRRAVLRGRNLGIKEMFLGKIAPLIFELNKDAYPELVAKSDYILKVLQVEEKRFYETLEQGLDILNTSVKKMEQQGEKIFTGTESFKLYDTYGFPIELMREILEEYSITVDEEAFKEELEKQRKRAREARAESTYMGSDGSIFDGVDLEATEFVGYNELNVDGATVCNLFNEKEEVDVIEDGVFSLVVDKTPFYAEGGGQCGDTGLVYNNAFKGEIVDTKKVHGKVFVHVVKVLEGSIKKNDKVSLQVDRKNRQNISRNHTATHLLQNALRTVVGTHVEQSGSSVTGNRLRFDFTNFSPLSREEIKQIEQIVNDFIYDDIEGHVSNCTIDEAREKGAMALFGEKYGDEVRVVEFDNSIELCGGIHVNRTSEIGIFKILGETGISAGVRRIEAVTGRFAQKYFEAKDDELFAITEVVKATQDNVLKKVVSNVEEIKELNRKLTQLQDKMSQGSANEVIDKLQVVNGYNLIVANMNGVGANELKTLGDNLKEKVGSLIVCLIGTKDDKIEIVSMVTDDYVQKGAKAGAILRDVATVLDGRGGGRDNMAQGSGKDMSKIDDAIKKCIEVVEQL